MKKDLRPEETKKLQEILICECGLPEHQLIVRAEQEEGEDPEVYFHVHLTHRPFWGRLITAFRYLFGERSGRSAWDEVVISRQHLPQLEKIVQFLKEDGKDN